MRLRSMVSSVVMATVIATGVSVVISQDALAAGKVKRTEYRQGILGKVIVNPYKVAPLTAIIDRKGNHSTDIKVTVLGKPNGGVDITYNVSDDALLHHDGIPVFGLYEGYLNQVQVDYKLDGKSVSEVYKIRTNPFQARLYDGRFEGKPKIEAKKLNPAFKDRLYLTTFMADARTVDWGWIRNSGHGHDKVVHGAGEWQQPTEVYMFDTQGEIRWYLDTYKFYDEYGRSIDDLGRMMSMHFFEDGDLLLHQAQKYYRLSMLGEMAYERKLPRGYVDISHEVTPMPNGHVLLRVAKKDYAIPGTKDYATTIRDVIIEVDNGGKLVQEWDFNKIMDKDVFRDNLFKALDPKAVCLNIDMNAEHIEIDDSKKTPYGDNPTTGTGHNWAHINSISYIPEDDSIIASLRHQGIVKVGRDMKIDWILAPNVGWSKKNSAKILTPVDKKGKKLDCEGAKCENTEFDWPWSQHTVWRSTHGKNDKRFTTISVFDNGDGRGMEQPAFSTDKYSRGVEFTIDEKNMTVTQNWEFGKERGFDFYSVVTSNTQYEEDTKTYHIFSADTNLLTKNRTVGVLVEVDPKDNNVELEMNISVDKKPGAFYRTEIVRPNKLFKF